MESLCRSTPTSRRHGTQQSQPGRRRRAARTAPRPFAAGAHARRDRRGFRRYRHLAALRDEGELHRAASAGGRSAAHLRRAQPDLLVADADRHGQICRWSRCAPTIKRRGRLLRAAVADLAQPRRTRSGPPSAGDDRACSRPPVLRRRDDHAGDFGAVGGRGADHRRGAACSRWSCRSRSASWSACS